MTFSSFSPEQLADSNFIYWSKANHYWVTGTLTHTHTYAGRPMSLLVNTALIAWLQSQPGVTVQVYWYCVVCMWAGLWAAGNGRVGTSLAPTVSHCLMISGVRNTQPLLVPSQRQPDHNVIVGADQQPGSVVVWASTEQEPFPPCLAVVFLAWRLQSDKLIMGGLADLQRLRPAWTNLALYTYLPTKTTVCCFPYFKI